MRKMVIGVVVVYTIMEEYFAQLWATSLLKLFVTTHGNFSTKFDSLN